MNSKVTAVLMVALLGLARGDRRDESKGPGGIVLLPGFVAEDVEGIDSSPGRIFKKNGLAIEYDIGFMSGNWARSRHLERKDLYYQSQVIGSRRIEVVIDTDNVVRATIDRVANFKAKVTSQTELSDFYLTVVTYDPVKQR